MRNRFNKIIKNIQDTCKKTSEIEGLLLFGSQISNESLFSSDIDLITIYEKFNDWNSFIKKIGMNLKKINEKISFHLRQADKFVIFLEDNLLKIELYHINLSKLNTLYK